MAHLAISLVSGQHDDTVLQRIESDYIVLLRTGYIFDTAPHLPTAVAFYRS